MLVLLFIIALLGAQIYKVSKVNLPHFKTL
jgi:hypothetical protein